MTPWASSPVRWQTQLGCLTLFAMRRDAMLAQEVATQGMKTRQLFRGERAARRARRGDQRHFDPR